MKFRCLPIAAVLAVFVGSSHAQTPASRESRATADATFWTACVVDANNVCQGVFALPAMGGAYPRLIPKRMGVDDGADLIVLGGGAAAEGAFALGASMLAGTSADPAAAVSPDDASATAPGLPIGFGPTPGGASDSAPHNNAGSLGNLATVNSRVLLTFDGGAPAIASTSPRATPANAAALGALPNEMVAISDGPPLNVLLINYGALNEAFPNYNCRTAGGSHASPVAVQNGDALCGFYAFGYNGSAFSQSAIGLEFVAAENFTTAANGTEYWFYATPTGLTANQITASLTGNGVFTLGVVNALGAIVPGSGYADGTYTGVPLTDSSSHPGAGAQATIVVYGGGVASVALTSAGENYTTSSVLSASSRDLGGAGSGFSVPVATINGTGGAITSGFTGQISLINSAYGGGPIGIRNAGATGPGYDFDLPATPGLAGQYLASNGPGNLQTWNSLNAIVVGGYADNVNFDGAETDTAITITLPAGVANYRVHSCILANASASLAHATVGLFTAKDGGGTPVVAGGSAVTVNTAAANANNNTQALTISNAETQSYNLKTLYFRVATPQGSPATASVVVYIMPLP
jgi:hypothetical protein